MDTSTFRHVGGTNEIRVDVRVLTATNRDLSSMVRQRLFREDLFYRLRTITVEVPPLRPRGADVEPLAHHFVTMLNERFHSEKKISADALHLLRRHSCREMCVNFFTWSKQPWCYAKGPVFCRSTFLLLFVFHRQELSLVFHRTVLHYRRCKRPSGSISGWRWRPIIATAETRPELSV